MADWTDEERNSLASGLLRLGAGLHDVHGGGAGHRPDGSPGDGGEAAR